MISGVRDHRKWVIQTSNYAIFIVKCLRDSAALYYNIICICLINVVCTTDLQCFVSQI
jgi:hypothetical protein